jgi:hypothetical protein
LQVGETGTRGYSQITVQKPATRTPFALPSVWSYLWPRPPRTRAFWLQPAISGQMASMPSSLATAQCLLPWPMYTW